MTGRKPASMKTILGVSCVAACVIAFAAHTVPSSSASNRTALRQAPLNPEFQNYLLNRQTIQPLALTCSGRVLGEIPGPNIPSPVRPFSAVRTLEAAPLFFDLRNMSKLPPVRNQGGCGSCWAFATYGSLESYLLPGRYADYSENHLIHNHGYSWGPCTGGNVYLSMGYLTRWAGPINEAQSPYPYSCFSSLASSADVMTHVQDIRLIPPRLSSADNDLIKAGVLALGAVYVSMYWTDAGWNPLHNSFCNSTGMTGGGGHAVCVVGWDDNFDRNKFIITPEGDGAFIVRNSWGSDWGENGYFYVSYYDTDFGRWNFSAAFSAESTANYRSVYQYDPLGWVTSWGYGSNEASAANVFKAVADDTIGAVGFYAVSSNCSYEISLYSGCPAGSPKGEFLRASTAGNLAYPGYYTIVLPAPVPVASGQRFSVILKCSTPGYDFPIASENRLAGYSDGSICSTGESFLSPDGVIWEDISADAMRGSNVCLKAYAGPKPNLTVTAPSSGTSWMRGLSQTIAWMKTGSEQSNVRIQLRRKRRLIKNIALRTKNDGSYEWTVPAGISPASDYFIRIRTLDGKATDDGEPFSITRPRLDVIEPKAGSVWTRDTTRDIVWTTNAPRNVDVMIQLYRNGGLVLDIGRAALNDGRYSWLIPSRLRRGSGYFIKIKMLDNKLRDKSVSFALD